MAVHNRERRFDLDELVFSTTDKKGIIEFGASNQRPPFSTSRRVSMPKRCWLRKISREIKSLMAVVKNSLLEATSIIDEIRTSMRNLQSIHFTGLVEAAKCEEATSFEVIFSDVQEQVSIATQELEQFAAIILANIATISSLELLDTESNLSELARQFS